jgi:beta-lactamase regulating signal transducer with metallopeptidase domain
MMFAQALAMSLAPALQAVGWALLHLVWQGAAIAAALALLLAFLPSRSANLRYALSCAALALLVVVGVLTGLRSYAIAAHEAPRLVRHPIAALPLAPARARAVAPAPPSLATIVVATFAPARVASMPDPWRAASDALPTIVTLWIVGVTLLSLRLVVQWLRARRLVTVHAQPACEPWLAMARRLGVALGVRRAVRLLESTVVQVPAVVGLLRPVILLPANTLTGLLPGQLEMILAHELAHIRRHDLVVNLLQAAVETLLFYHPAVWWISRQVRIERENCCDDLAVGVCGDPLQYARALTRLEELRGEALALAVSARGGLLLHRIRRVVGGPAPSSGPVRGVTALALLLGLALAFAGPSLTAIARPQVAEKTQFPTVRAATTMASSPTTVTTAHPARPACVQSAHASQCPDATDANVTDSPTVTGEPVAAEATVASSPDADDDGGTALVPNSTEAIAHGRIRLTVDELIELRSQGVSTADILEMRSVFPDIDISRIAGMYAVGATPEYVQGIRAAGLELRSYEEAKSMAAVGVTPEFIADMRNAGLAVKSPSEASSLVAVGVTSEYIRSMRAAGFAIASADEVRGMAAVGVTPEYVRDMRAAGFEISSAREAQGLVAVGVTPEYVRGMRASGLRLASANELQGCAAVGVSPEYVSELREAGIVLRDAHEAQSLAAVGVTPKLVRKLAKAGYANLSVSDLCRLAAGGVNDSFIDEMSQYRSR